MAQNGLAKKRVALIGSGNWGSAIASIIGKNVVQHDAQFEPEIRMYVYEEQVEDPAKPGSGEKRPLSELINERHENCKYLPGIPLPESIVADPDLVSTCKGADILIWVVPHQFVGRMIPQVKDVVAEGAVSVSLIKGGIDVKDGKIELVSDLIKEQMGHPCFVLMGANVANEVAGGDFCEATLGYEPVPEEADDAARARREAECRSLTALFHVPAQFEIAAVPGVPGVELCGALKNIVALGAGFVDGLEMGGNTKAAVIRLGLRDMKNFIARFYGARDGPKDAGAAAPSMKRPRVGSATGAGQPTSDVFFESCGFADIVTTCYGGRNRKCAEAFARQLGKAQAGEIALGAAAKQTSWNAIEKELLNGQKLQGTLTCEEILSVLRNPENDCEAAFPFFSGVWGVAFGEGVAPAEMFRRITTGGQVPVSGGA